MNSRTDFSFVGTDGLLIAASRWQRVPRPRGIVQVSHGMGEHAGRYAEMPEFLASRGFVVLANDHRGHGRTARTRGKFGDFGTAGFDGLVADMSILTSICLSEFPGLPLVLLGHSMGSFAAQKYVLKSSADLTGLVLSGSGALDLILGELTRWDNMAGEMANARFEPVRTPFDWLTRDRAEIEAYIADPLCFPRLSPAANATILDNAHGLADADALNAIRKDLPIYLFSGSLDPVGQELCGVKLLAQRYAAAGLNDITCEFYPGGRHEMLHETNRGEVLENLLVWIERVI